jgi:hypothetical protein
VNFRVTTNAATELSREDFCGQLELVLSTRMRFRNRTRRNRPIEASVLHKGKCLRWRPEVAVSPKCREHQVADASASPPELLNQLL